MDEEHYGYCIMNTLKEEIPVKAFDYCSYFVKDDYDEPPED